MKTRFFIFTTLLFWLIGAIPVLAEPLLTLPDLGENINRTLEYISNDDEITIQKLTDVYENLCKWKCDRQHDECEDAAYWYADNEAALLECDEAYEACIKKCYTDELADTDDTLDSIIRNIRVD